MQKKKNAWLHNACYLIYYFKIECSALLFHSECSRCLSDIMIWFTWQILHDITTVLTNPRAPLGLLRQRVQSNLELGREAEFELIVSTLDVWNQQLTSLAVSKIWLTFWAMNLAKGVVTFRRIFVSMGIHAILAWGWKISPLRFRNGCKFMWICCVDYLKAAWFDSDFLHRYTIDRIQCTFFATKKKDK